GGVSWRSFTAFAKGAFSVTTAMCACSFTRLLIIIVGSTPQAIESAGVSSVKMMNALVRTRSRYSRFVISQMFLRDALRIGFAHHFNKYLFERRFHQFELIHARFLGDIAHEFVRIGTGRQSDKNVSL